MLILTRKRGETVVIGDNVAVTVLGVKGQQVRIGIAAPDDVAIHREEVLKRQTEPTPEQAPSETGEQD